MAVIVAIYFVETIALPPTFSAGLPSVDGVPPAHAVAENSHSILSLEQATQVFISGHPEGINSLDDVDEIAYLPDSDIYRFENKQRFFEWYVDARTGEILKYGFNTNVFLQPFSNEWNLVSTLEIAPYSIPLG